jgi:signal transduction histidine kinase
MSQLNGTSSLGMANMHQRAKLLKGELQVSSDGKNGTEVSLNIPL